MNSLVDKDDDTIINYEFTPYEDLKLFPNIFNKENYKLLEKWGLVQNMEIAKFRFNKNFDLKELDQFVNAFVSDKKVRVTLSALQTVEKPEKVKYNRISTKATNLDILNPMYENLCSQETGYIRKDYDEYFEEIQISDKLKQALLLEESEDYCVFNEATRNEFLFHIFKRIVVGGALCQFEDTVNDYLTMTKLFYKDFVSASKDANTGEIVIKSIVLEIEKIDDCNLYSKPYHPQNFFYMVIDPFQRHVNVWYHKWVPWW
jgi:hypothetical protein